MTRFGLGGICLVFDRVFGGGVSCFDGVFFFLAFGFFFPVNNCLVGVESPRLSRISLLRVMFWCRCCSYGFMSSSGEGAGDGVGSGVVSFGSCDCDGVEYTEDC